ncbi:MAG: tryptophan synthase subunit alpha [Planctomycetaceae bacterium]|nr:tryptophan synthase subunit alpha [Planctomycetaceae bacterium]
MSNLRKAFEKGKAFIPFITCGDPDLETTGKIVREAVKNGADLIELGIPFSDPTAEGPVIQSANARALAGGATTDKIFDLVRELRKELTIPLVFMTYANVVFSYDSERFIRTCAEIGIDGLVIPDLPFEERDEFLPICRKYRVALISMVTPASSGRIAMIAREAEGFLYVVSCLGLTETRDGISTDLASIMNAVREVSDVPCAVRLESSTFEEAEMAAHEADGVIAGSPLVKLIEHYGANAVVPVGELIQRMKNVIR